MPKPLLSDLSERQIRKARIRFLSSIAFGDTGDSCWIWNGIKDKDGYGVFNLKSACMRAHRAAILLSKTELTNGLVVDHICRNRACVRPSHLRQVTPRENTLAENCNSWSAKNAKKTHCPRGHAYNEENTYKTKAGGRLCRLCSKLRKKENKEIVNKQNKLSSERRRRKRGVREKSGPSCKRGHLFTKENTYLHSGRRHCKECARMRRLARRAKREATAARD